MHLIYYKWECVFCIICNCYNIVINITFMSNCMLTVTSGGSRISHKGGAKPVGDANTWCACGLKNVLSKWINLNPWEPGVPPGSTNVYYLVIGSGGSRISWRGFRKFCMSTRKDLDPTSPLWSANNWAYH